MASTCALASPDSMALAKSFWAESIPSLTLDSNLLIYSESVLTKRCSNILRLSSAALAYSVAASRCLSASRILRVSLEIRDCTPLLYSSSCSSSFFCSFLISLTVSVTPSSLIPGSCSVASVSTTPSSFTFSSATSTSAPGPDVSMSTVFLFFSSGIVFSFYVNIHARDPLDS